MPPDMEQESGEPVLYLLLSGDGTLLEAAGTRELFWEKWQEVGSRMKPDAVILESSEAVMVIPKMLSR